MGGRGKGVDAYLARASGPFREAFDGVEAVVRGIFPEAASVLAYGMPGWSVRVRDAPPPGYKGTLDPTHLTILLADRKTGITLHVWNPLEEAFLESHRPAMERGGLKVMRGCLAFRRKGPYPLGAVEALLRAAAEGVR